MSTCACPTVQCSGTELVYGLPVQGCCGTPALHDPHPVVEHDEHNHNPGVLLVRALRNAFTETGR